MGYDGHGSTRTLTDAVGAVTNTFHFDGYGMDLGWNRSDSVDYNQVNKPATDMLYSGEQYDTPLQMQSLRARYYDQNVGGFNRLDDYAGNMHDPQSLHKYAYCHGDGVNCIDPSGRTSLLDILSTVANIATAVVKFWPALRIGLFVVDAIEAVNIIVTAIVFGPEAVTAGEWITLGLIFVTALAGGKLARKVATSIIRRFLGISKYATSSLGAMKAFVRSHGIPIIINQTDDVYRNGERVLGAFAVSGSLPGMTSVKITLYKGGNTMKTLIHEFVHYFQFIRKGGRNLHIEDWKKYVEANEDALETLAYFVDELFFP